nr:CDP-glycerol glycerophosphotransferase family protein [uncultured Blautia sp.]
MEKILKLLKSKTVKNMAYYVGNSGLRIVYLVIALFSKTSNKKVVFFNYNGKGYGDNPKYVAKKIYELDPNIEMVWMIKEKDSKMPEYIKQVKLFSISGMKECASAKVWISNARLHLFLYKKKSQKYFQLWHGGCGPKKIEGAAADKMISWYKTAAKHDSKMADYFVSNSKFNTKMIRESFWYSGEILNYGSPRHDPFFLHDISSNKQLEKELKIDSTDKLILYAPTFRNDKNTAIYRWDYAKLLTAAKNYFGGTWKFVLRLHPNINFLDAEFEFGNDIVNGSQYDDMQELIQRADIIVTDYSGVMMQAALAGKYVMLLIPDKREYLDERGLCIDIEKAPFPKGSNCEDLVNIIYKQNVEEYKENLRKFLSTFEFYDDGFASNRVASKVLEYME